MSTILTIFFMIIPVISIFAAVYSALHTVKCGHAPKSAMVRHFVTLLIVSTLLIALGVGVYAASDEPAVSEVETESTETASANNGLGLLAAALCTGLAGIGGGIALAAGAPAAIGATSEDQKNFSKSLIFVALGETIALYGVVISVMIISKL